MRTDTEKAAAANAIQLARDKAEYDRAVENVAWLSEPHPKWDCGTPVTSSDIDHLLKLNQSIVDRKTPQ